MERKIHRETSDALLAEINEHRRAEEALRASEQRLQGILDNSTAVVSVKDLDLRYIFANREYERQFHVQRDQIHGKTDYDIHPRAVVALQTELENRELRLSYSRPERTSLDER